ncbi:hypothetical protein [Mixta intestinalis]|uniref:Uncharacterized protein n=1 Tax=Mixta intestinalis TaxID=1615494 RepID=A0A6P1PV57_9GAMM|nr:hypothetical protein [Mixta intestinalis]QHM70376.1 hypothetical protein C7M51_00649 [Mixta intestinalis]
MKYAKFSVVKFFSWAVSHILEAVITGVCSFAALMSLFLFNGFMKFIGFSGFFLLGYLLTLGLGLLRNER